MIIEKAPTPDGAPLIGSMLELRRDPLSAFLEAFREHGDVVRFPIGPLGLRWVLYGVFSAEAAHRVLASDSANFRKDNRFFTEFREFLGDSLFTSQDEVYIRQRRLVQPMFTPRRVARYAEAVCDEVRGTVERWQVAPDQTIDLSEEIPRLTLRIITRILFGADIEVAVDVVRRCLPGLGAYVERRSLAPVRIPRWWPMPANRWARAKRRELYAVCEQIIEERRSGGSGGEDLLGLLVQARGKDRDSLQGAEIRDQVLIFLLAGHDTTATSLAFALYALARRPAEQTRVRDEVLRVLGRRAPRADDLQVLPYTTMVVKEAMRLYPAAPMISRRAVKGVRVGGVRIPAGADVIVSPWVIHRRSDYWGDNPEGFEPERFSPERSSARLNGAWIPFGAGPRTCIGQHISMLESILALAVVVQALEFQAVDSEVPLASGVTLRAGGPMRCRLTAR